MVRVGFDLFVHTSRRQPMLLTVGWKKSSLFVVFLDLP